MQAGKLTMLQQGENWSAYYETPGNALFLGSIRMAIVLHNTARKEAFLALMQDATVELIQNATGHG